MCTEIVHTAHSYSTVLLVENQQGVFPGKLISILRDINEV